MPSPPPRALSPGLCSMRPTPPFPTRPSSSTTTPPTRRRRSSRTAADSIPLPSSLPAPTPSPSPLQASAKCKSDKVIVEVNQVTEVSAAPHHRGRVHRRRSHRRSAGAQLRIALRSAATSTTARSRTSRSTIAAGPRSPSSTPGVTNDCQRLRSAQLPRHQPAAQ